MPGMRGGEFGEHTIEHSRAFLVRGGCRQGPVLLPHCCPVEATQGRIIKMLVHGLPDFVKDRQWGLRTGCRSRRSRWQDLIRLGLARAAKNQYETEQNQNLRVP